MEKMKIDKIKIPYSFTLTPVGPKKISKKKRLIEEGRSPSVTINVDDLLKDGYATFLAYEEMGYDEVPVVRINAQLPTRTDIIKRDKYTCYICKRKLPEEELTIDHVVPRLKGGDSTEENLKCCCRLCNQLKANFSFSKELVGVIKMELEERGVSLNE